MLRCMSRVAFLVLAWLAMAVPAAMGQSTRYAFSNFAGLVGGPGSVDGTGSVARFNYPDGAAVDAAGNVYVADTGNHTIRKVTSAGVVTTFAGSAGNIGSTDAPAGPATVARFNNPQRVAVDAAGNVYVADTGNHTIRRITPGGVVSTLAGSANFSGSLDGTGAAARFFLPAGVAVDAAGANVYVADTRNYTIRKSVTATGAVTTIAGAASNLGSTDAPAGPGSVARFNTPEGIAVDAAGNLYVADTGNDTIRKIAPAGVVSTYAGTAGAIGSVDGAGTFATFNSPQGVAVDVIGNVYVADTGNHTIRKIDTLVAVTTLAAVAGVSGAADGTGGAAEFYRPASLAVDAAGANIYVADTFNLTVRKVTAAGVVTTLAGMSQGTGIADGSGTAARFNNPLGVATDTAGNSYVADTGSHTIRMISPAGLVSTLAGDPGNLGSADGTGPVAQFYNPSGVAVDAAFNVYVADTGNHTIRKVAPGGVVTTLAGTAGIPGSTDATGANARFSSRQGVALDTAGNVYVADTGNHTIRKITPAGAVTTFIGTAGGAGSRNGVGSGGTASGAMTNGVGFAAGSRTIGTSSTDGTGTILAGDIVSFGSDPSGYLVTTGTTNLKGRGTAGGAQTGGTAIVVGSTVIDTGGVGTGSILAGDVVTFPGDPNKYIVSTGTTNVAGVAVFPNPPPGSFIILSTPLLVALPAVPTPILIDGSSITIASPGLLQAIPTVKAAITIISTAQLNSPKGVAVDVAGNVYVADTGNNTIRKITPARVAATLAGSAGTSGTNDGVLSSARFKNPSAVAVDAIGDMYVADTGNYTIRKITSLGVVSTVGGTPGILGSANGAGLAARFYNPSSVALDATGNIYVADTRNNRISRGVPFLAFGTKIKRDFNSDGADDIIFQNSLGQVAVWYLNGAGAISSAGWISTGLMGDWGVVGLADMNGDSTADIVFQNTSGQIAVWYMNGAGGVTSAALISAGGLGDWRIVGVTDMNNDGNADLIFQNNAGQIVVWYMNGGGGVLTFSFLSPGALGDWRIVGVADLNGDSNADIVFQNTLGQIVVWYLNGSGAVSSAAYLSTGAMGDWKVSGIADLNGDGNADLVFKNTAGQIVVWYLNGAGPVSSAAFISTGSMPGWRVR